MRAAEPALGAGDQHFGFLEEMRRGCTTAQVPDLRRDGIAKQPSEPTQKAKGDPVTNTPKQASMTNETRAA